MIHNISGFLALPLPHSSFPFTLVLASWSKSVACLNPKNGLVAKNGCGGSEKEWWQWSLWQSYAQ